MLYLLSSSCVLTLPFSTLLFSLDIFDCCSVPGDVEDYISGLDDF
jgi:hypothetical protein